MANEYKIHNGLVIAGALEAESISTPGGQMTLDNDVIASGTISASGVSPLNASGMLGTLGNEWEHLYANNVHTGDIHMKNDEGNWTLQEGSDSLFAINNLTGKKYKIVLEEL